MTTTGSIGLALEALRGMIADSETFRAWVGAVTTGLTDAQIHQAALASVYVETIGPAPGRASEWEREDLEAIRPFVIVGVSPSAPYVLSRAGGGPGPSFPEGGNLVLEFEATVDGDDADSPSGALYAFTDMVSKVLCEVAERACDGDATPNGYGRLDIRTMRVESVFNCHEDEIATRGDYMVAVVAVSWGIQSGGGGGS